MVPLENADSSRRIQINALKRFKIGDLLMVCVPDPGKRAQDRDGNREVCKYAHSQHRVGVVAVINKDRDHPEH